MKTLTTKKPTLPTKFQAALTFSEPRPGPEPEKEASGKRSFNAPAGHKRLTINLPEDLHKRLRIAAAERERNATDIIVELLTKELS